VPAVIGSAFLRTISVVGLIGSLTIQPAAQATPIGVFSWDDQGAEGCLFCGPLFSVGNFSDDETLSLGALGGSFLDVSVDLQLGGGDIQELALGEVAAPGFSSQSFEDLLGSNILFAALRLTFAVPTLPGSVRLLNDGIVVAGLFGPGSLVIDYAVDEVPTTVPEPATLLLLTGGLIGLAVARKGRRGTAPTQSRMKRSFGHVLSP
jgi:hypothetical protein